MAINNPIIPTMQAPKSLSETVMLGGGGSHPGGTMLLEGGSAEKPMLGRYQVDKELGKVTPYGVYDLSHNIGWVSVGIDHDTAEFAVETLRRWWREMGRALYPKATRLLITADGGGSNGSRVRLWKVPLQQLARRQIHRRRPGHQRIREGDGAPCAPRVRDRRKAVPDRVQ